MSLFLLAWVKNVEDASSLFFWLPSKSNSRVCSVLALSGSSVPARILELEALRKDSQMVNFHQPCASSDFCSVGMLCGL